MQESSWQSALTRRVAWLLPSFLVACQSSPAELYVLSAQPAPTSSALSQAKLVDATGRPAPHSVSPGKPLGTVGIAVSVPEYLDRPEIVERAGANELKPSYKAQWAESLSIDASRVVSEDLEAFLPSANVVLLPSRARRSIDYEVNVNLVRFESDAAGSAIIVGDWTIGASDGHELASGRFRRSEPIARPGFGEMAAAMSRNLAAVSADIADALGRLSPSLQNAPATQGKAIAPAHRPRHEREAGTPAGTELDRP
jgi:uncharacterized lipoprotein YmbA